MIPLNPDVPRGPQHEDFLAEEIIRLKKEKNAILLAHYYQNSEIQDIADFIGDSLELARIAQKTQSRLIVFAGVHFMAEGAKILNPEATVLVPDLRAGCSLAHSCPPEAFAHFRSQHPNHFVVSYINCSAAIKAQSDVICTSSNAIKIINQIPQETPILFAPDRNLGAYLAQKTQRSLLLWQGSCIVHETFSERKTIDLMIQYPEAELLAHPECEPSFLKRAHFIGSTSALLKHTQQNDCQTFIVATEEGILHSMRKHSPHKTFLAAPPRHQCECNECPFMKLNTLEKVYLALRDESPSIHLEESLRKKAYLALAKMLEWSALDNA